MAPRGAGPLLQKQPEELQALGENGWKIKSETRGEPGRASEICPPQTPSGEQFVHKLKSGIFFCCKLQTSILSRNSPIVLFFFRGGKKLSNTEGVDGHVLNKASP